jgi:hypothetical protein
MVALLQRKLLSLLSTVTLLDACSAFYNNEFPKSAFVISCAEQPRARRLLWSSSSKDERSSTIAATGGPRGEARRGRRSEGRSSRRTHSQRQVSSVVREARTRTTTKSATMPSFDGKSLSSEQTPNEQEAPPFDLFANLENKKSIRCMSDFENGQTLIQGNVVATQQRAFEFVSLDDLTFSLGDGGQQPYYKLPGFSKRFNSDAPFRRALRQAMRLDIYETTPQYANLSPKAKEMLLLPDSSLQGSWRRSSSTIPQQGEIRMKRLTQVLHDAFAVKRDDDGDDSDDESRRFCCPTGDDLMQAIGDLCGPEPSTHFIDIVGVLDRRIPHSWHQDTGRSGATTSSSSSKTVLWGFPAEDDYTGCGVFSHVVSLLHESQAPASHPNMQPILFDGKIDDSYIVRPCYGPGRELLLYRDVDVLHSSPDVTYRTSVMRFM